MINQFIGVEIEMEQHLRDLSGSLVVNKFWTRVEDGSLQNGVEFVLREPLKGEALEMALDAFEANALEPLNTHGGARCSVHVHLDVRDLDRMQRTRLLALVALFDKLLFHVTNNIERAKDVFSVPLVESADNPFEYTSGFKSFNGKSYSSVSMSSIRKFGSLEFRHLGLPQSMDDVRKFIAAICDMKEWVLRQGAITSGCYITSVLHSLSEFGPRDFIREVFVNSFDLIENGGSLPGRDRERLIFEAVGSVQVWRDTMSLKPMKDGAQAQGQHARLDIPMHAGLGVGQMIAQQRERERERARREAEFGLFPPGRGLDPIELQDLENAWNAVAPARPRNAIPPRGELGRIGGERQQNQAPPRVQPNGDGGIIFRPLIDLDEDEGEPII